MASKKLSAIILAAGRGTRMASPLPKVLHPVAGKPMLQRVIETVKALGATEVRVIVGYGENLVKQVVEPLGGFCFKQEQQLGTADAVKSAKVNDLEGDVLILNGDHPLLVATDLKKFVDEFRNSDAKLAVATCVLENPGDFGRIVRHKGELRAIVEVKEASADTLSIKEVNTGIYLVTAEILNELLPLISNNNAKKEFYLTDLIGLCHDKQKKMIAVPCSKNLSFGVNSQKELAMASKEVFLKKVEQLMDKGVVVVDPSNTYIEESVEIGEASVIYPGVYLRGETKIGKYCVIEPNTYIIDTKIEDSVVIRANCYFEKSVIKAKATLGPFARLRPESEIGVEAHVGNFVEMKKVKFGDRSKAGHLTYLGDAEIGKDVNIGCGTITCNYAVDKKKYKTKIGDGVFVGSDTQFVAPVNIGDKAVIGSGSTITKDVPSKALAVARGKQFIKENYVSDAKKED